MDRAASSERVGRYVRSNRALHEALGIAFDEAEGIEVHPLKQGEHNANYWFAHPGTGARHVVRVNYASQLGLADQIGYEFAALEYLCPSGCTPRPRYCDPSKAFEGHGVLVMDFCEGEWIDYANLAHMECAAQLVADVHSIPIGDTCPILRINDPLQAQFDECAGHFKVYRDSALAEARVVQRIERLFGSTRGLLDAACDGAEDAHILNTELVQSHFLIEDAPGVCAVRQDGAARVSLASRARGYLVDWEKPIVGEAAQDVAYLLSPTTTIWDADFVFSEGQRQLFLEAYWRAVDGRFGEGSFWRRFPAYVATNALRGITWSAHAWIDYRTAAVPLRNQKTFERLGIYQNDAFLDLVEEACF